MLLCHACKILGLALPVPRFLQAQLDENHLVCLRAVYAVLPLLLWGTCYIINQACRNRCDNIAIGILREGTAMNKVRITVLKTTLDRELAAEYGAEGLGACPMHEAGQVLFVMKDFVKRASQPPGGTGQSSTLRNPP